MIDRESIPALAIGFIIALVAHAMAVGGYVRMYESPPPEDAARVAINSSEPCDLVADQMEVSEPRIAGKPFTVTVNIINAGRAVAPPFEVLLEVDGQAISMQRHDERLDRDASTQHTFTHTIAQPGLHRIAVIVDPQNRITERSEANNRIEQQLNWQAPPEGSPRMNKPLEPVAPPDLAVDQLSAAPRIATELTTVRFRVTNQGGPMHAASLAAIQLNGEWLNIAWEIPPMQPGESRELQGQIIIAEPGEHTLTIVADPENTLRETDEQNNIVEGKFVWRAKNKPTPGSDEGGGIQVKLISWDDYRQLMARHGSFDQATTQRNADPDEQARTTPINPTRPGPSGPPNPSSAQANPTPPTPPTPAAPAAPKVPPALPIKPTPATEITEQTDTTEPAAPESDVTAEDVTARHGDRTTAARSQPRQASSDETAKLTDDLPSPTPVDALMTRTQPGDELRITTAPITPELGIDPTIALAVPTEKDSLIERTSPEIMPVEAARPTPDSAEVDAPERDKPELAALPIDAEPRPIATALDRPNEADKPITEQARPQLQPQPNRPTAQVTPRPKPTPQTQPQTPKKTGSNATPTLSPKADSESPPAVRSKYDQVQPGQVLNVRGTRIRIVMPRFDMVAQMTATVRNPVFDIEFGPDGKVIKVTTKRSSGYANIDSPILNSIYKWTATGKRIPKQLILEDLRYILRPER